MPRTRQRTMLPTGMPPGEGGIPVGRANTAPPLPMAPLPAPVAPPRPPEMDPDHVEKLADHIVEYWEPCRERQQEDTEILCGVWDSSIQGATGHITKGSMDLPADTTIPQAFLKYVAVIGGGTVQLDAQIDNPASTDLTEKGEIGWRYMERQWQKQHVLAGRGDFAYAETRYVCREGFICQRLWFARKKYLAGKFPVECTIVDPKSVSYWEGDDGLDLVVQDYQATKHAVMTNFPELDQLQDVPALANLEPYDDVTVRTVYDRNYVYVFVEEAYVGSIFHGFQLVPWIIIPAQSLTEPFGHTLDNGNRWSWRMNLTQRGRGSLPPTKNVGLSCIQNLKGVVAYDIALASMATRALELSVYPLFEVEGPDPSSIRLTREPGGRINIPPGYKVTTVEMGQQLESLNLLIQRNQQLKNRVIPDGAYGATPGVTSAIDRSMVNQSINNNYQPFVGAREEAARQRLLMTMRFYINVGDDAIPMTFGREIAEGKLAPASLNRDEMEELLEAEWKATIGNLLPQERQAAAGLAATLLHAGLYDRQAALEFMNEPDPQKIIDRIDAEKILELPYVGSAKSAQAMAKRYPALWNTYGQKAFQALSRKAMADMTSGTEQAEAMAAMIHAHGGMPPPGGPGGPPPGPAGGPPPGAGPGGPNTPGSSPLPPTGGPPPGSGLGNQTSAAGPLAPPSPGPVRPPMLGAPGMAGLMGGLGGLPGGAPLPPGAGPNIMSPYNLGQVQLPQQADPTHQLMQELLAQGRPPPPQP